MSLSDWLDERTGHRALLDRWKGAPTKGGGSFAQVWGGVTALCLLVIVVTGILMMTAYQPSATTAWSSVHYIQTKLSLGWFIRGLHHNGAHFLVVLMVLHLVRTTVFAAYRKPRELTWLLGLALLGLTLAFVRTGYLLPWDQEGYWATYIPLNILGTMPGGSALKELAIGGGELGHMAITRFHALHVAILPMGLVLLLWALAALARKHGLTAHPAADTTKSEPYFPAQAGRVAIVGMIVLAALVVFTVSTHGVPLQAPPDPAPDYPARPAGYFRAPFHTP